MAVLNEAMSIEEFTDFYRKMMKIHRWGIYGVRFGAKYIDSIIDTRDGKIWSITLRDIMADDDIWAQIPDAWKAKDGNLIKVTVRDVMNDKYSSLKERTDFLISLGA